MNNIKIPLAKDTISNEEIDALIEWLKTYPKLTKGDLTIKLEEEFSKWIGCKYSVFVNSGSSANLLMIAVLKEMGLLKYNRIVVPSLSWSTTLSPCLIYGIEVVLVDVNLSNLSVDLDHLEQIFIKYNSEIDSCIIVPILGLSPDFNKINDLMNKYGISNMLVDNCESEGTTFNGHRIGSIFGIMSSFSMFYGHISSSIEGGMITTNDKDIYDCLLMLRSHGWLRDLDVEKQQELKEEWDMDNFSMQYKFMLPAYNLRSTEINAFLELGQRKNIDKVVLKRNENFIQFKNKLSPYTWFPIEVENSFTSSFCIPLIAQNKNERNRIIKTLNDNLVENRPIVSSSMGTQPMYVKKYGELILPNASIIDERGLYIPNHPHLTQEEIDLMCKCVIDSLDINQK
jgi:CDP-6-deoxy-D-xylo-4-hexulose-3-dehydrase